MQFSCSLVDYHPDGFDFRLFEARNQTGGNAITVDSRGKTAVQLLLKHHVRLAFQKSEGLKASGLQRQGLVNRG